MVFTVIKMIDEILQFWFEEIDESKWWIKDAGFDQLIRTKFSDIHAQANRCELYEWRQTAQGRLAEIIVLDQFSRNMFRNTPQAFASDSLALVLAQEAIAADAEKQLNAAQRSFLYMPFMHSESLKIQEISLILFERNGIKSNYDFAIKHKKIIEQFGRYPHRNNILGRESTAQEVEFLKQPGSGF